MLKSKTQIKQETVDQAFERLMREQRKFWKIPSSYTPSSTGSDVISWTWYPEQWQEEVTKKGFLGIPYKSIQIVTKYGLTVYDNKGNRKHGYWEDWND